MRQFAFLWALALVLSPTVSAFSLWTNQNSNQQLLKNLGFFSGDLAALASNQQTSVADYVSSFGEPLQVNENEQLDQQPVLGDGVELEQSQYQLQEQPQQQQSQQQQQTQFSHGQKSVRQPGLVSNQLKSPAYRLRYPQGSKNSIQSNRYLPGQVLAFLPTESNAENQPQQRSFPWNWIFFSPVTQLHTNQQPVVLEPIGFGPGLSQVQGGKSPNQRPNQRLRRPLLSVLPSLPSFTNPFSSQSKYQGPVQQPIQQQQQQYQTQYQPQQIYRPIGDYQQQQVYVRPVSNQNYSTKGGDRHQSTGYSQNYYQRPHYESSSSSDYQVPQSAHPVVKETVQSYAVRYPSRVSLVGGSSYSPARLGSYDPSSFDSYESAPLPSILPTVQETQVPKSEVANNQTSTTEKPSQSVVEHSQQQQQQQPQTHSVSSISDSGSFFTAHNLGSSSQPVSGQTKHSTSLGQSSSSPIILG